MKYLRIFLTLIFVLAGALLYRDNDWMGNEIVINFKSIPFYSIAPIYTKTGVVAALAFLLGMLFTLIHSSLNWIDLMGKNKKISKLESEKTGNEEQI